VRGAARTLVFTVASILCAGGATVDVGPLFAGVGATVEPLVLQQLGAAGRADFFVRFAARGDLEPAAALGSKEARARFVLGELRRTAEDS